MAKSCKRGASDQTKFKKKAEKDLTGKKAAIVAMMTATVTVLGHHTVAAQ